jgi:hypothetical protein
MADSTDRLEAWSKIAQIVSVLVGVLATVIGLVISAEGFNDARRKEAEARKTEAQARIDELAKEKYNRELDARNRQIEAAKPFLQLRQERYTEVIKAAAILANPEGHDQDSVKKARGRFMDLYLAELSMVESSGVEGAMVELAKQISPELTKFTPAQLAAYKLSHALRDSLVKAWGIDEKTVDNRNPDQ